MPGARVGARGGGGGGELLLPPFARVYIADLADDLGNLVSRVVGMLHRFRAGTVPEPDETVHSELRALSARLPGDLDRALGEVYDPRATLDAVFALVARANRHVEERRPWALARDERAGTAGAARRLDAQLYELAEACRIVAEGLRPLLPETAERIAAALGVSLAANWTRGLEWGGIRPGLPVGPAGRLFPRPDLLPGGPGPAGEPAPARPVSGSRGSAGTGGRPPGA